MSNNKKKPTTSKFYNEPAMVEELYTGYLIKSPAQQALTKSTVRLILHLNLKSKYLQSTFPSKEKSVKVINTFILISLLFIGPEAHQEWDWIQKKFKCSPSSVLFLKVEDNTPKHSRDYFLIGKNSDDVDGWLNALVKVMKTQKSRYALQDNRFRSASEPVKSSEPKVEDEPDERRSAPELMLTYPSLYSHYDYPRKLSEPLLPMQIISEQFTVPLWIYSSSYFLVVFFSTSINGQESSVCNGAVNQEEDNENKREAHTHVKKDICVRKNYLKNSLILTQAEGKPCVSDCRKIQDSCLFHKGDQILAFNDLLIDTVEEIQTYVRRLSKDEVKLTIRRLIGSQPLHSEPCPS
uniref:PH domain-containing protein n=1 Tax=Sinocyclocheilus rhinocerous TaxID=307959 RepID=A0A673N2E2_9TELE